MKHLGRTGEKQANKQARQGKARQDVVVLAIAGFEVRAGKAKKPAAGVRSDGDDGAMFQPLLQQHRFRVCQTPGRSA